MPVDVIHKMKNLEEDPVILPRIREKVIFFPEEYVNLPISATHKK